MNSSKASRVTPKLPPKGSKTTVLRKPLVHQCTTARPRRNYVLSLKVPLGSVPFTPRARRSGATLVVVKASWRMWRRHLREQGQPRLLQEVDQDVLCLRDHARLAVAIWGLVTCQATSPSPRMAKCFLSPGPAPPSSLHVEHHVLTTHRGNRQQKRRVACGDLR